MLHHNPGRQHSPDRTLALPCCLPQLEGQRQDVEAALTGAEATIVELERRLRTRGAELEMSQREYEALHERAAVAEAAAQAEAEAATRREQKLQDQLSQAQADNAALRQQMSEEAAAFHAQLGEEAAARRAEAQAAKTALRTAQQEAGDTCALLAVAQREHAARQAQLQGRLREAEEEEAALRRQMDRQQWEAREAQRAQQEQATALQVGKRVMSRAGTRSGLKVGYGFACSRMKQLLGQHVCVHASLQHTCTENVTQMTAPALARSLGMSITFIPYFFSTLTSICRNRRQSSRHS